MPTASTVAYILDPSTGTSARYAQNTLSDQQRKAILCMNKMYALKGLTVIRSAPNYAGDEDTLIALSARSTIGPSKPEVQAAHIAAWTAAMRGTSEVNTITAQIITTPSDALSYAEPFLNLSEDQLDTLDAYLDTLLVVYAWGPVH